VDDEESVEEVKESPRIEEIGDDNSPPIIEDYVSDEEDRHADVGPKPASASPIPINLDGLSHTAAAVKRGEDSRSEEAALSHHRRRVSWVDIDRILWPAWKDSR